MKTITLETPGRFSLTDTPAPEKALPHEAVVRVHRVGICGTDLHAYRGKQPFFTYPRILGHELGVEVVAVATDNAMGIKVGDRCAVEPYLNCGTCIACRRGKPNCCVSMQVLGVHTDGGMREYIRVPIHKLHKSDRLTLEQLALVETLGIGARAVERSQLQPGEFALVIGAGPIGLAATQFALLAGAKVIVMDISAARLAFCRSQFGVEYTINASQAEPLTPLSEMTDGDLPTAVFDATGNPASMAQTFYYTAHGGRVVFISLVQADITFHDPDFHRRELTLLSTRNSTPQDFRRIISLIEAGRIHTTPWITHRAEPDEIIDAFPAWLKPESGTIKAMLTFTDTQPKQKEVYHE